MTAPMPTRVRERYQAELGRGRAVAGPEGWAALKAAHVLSQPWAGPHTRVHWAMLVRGWRERDRREVLGQLLRLVVAAPASWTGRYPVGNTGTADVPARQPMPIPDDLARVLDPEAGGRP
ncbi:MAG: hypothetical protein AMXMBFR46_22400 [Acidimicrobiia bacterium]